MAGASDPFPSWGEPEQGGEGDAPVQTLGSPGRGRRRAIFVCSTLAVLALAIGAFAAVSSGASPRTLRGNSFTTSYPAGWTIATRRKGAAAQYLLSSTGAAISGLGIGPAGTVGVTLEELPAPPKVRTESAKQLLQQAVGTPVKAVTYVRAPAIGSLDGAQAATFACAYTYRGVANVQVDLVALHGTTIIFLETNAEPAKASRASSALTMITAHWHWR